MERVSLEELAAATGGVLSAPLSRRTHFDGVSIDSREIHPGQVFWAIRGRRVDGHDFVEEAFQRGAVAAVVERQIAASGSTLQVKDGVQALGAFARWYRSLLDALVIGVTGSVGKTTTRELVHAALGGAPNSARSRKNFNNHLGVPLTLLDLARQTRFAVVEMGADRVGDIAELSRIARPEVGLITALGVAHIETFGSREAIVQAKGELVESLPRDGLAVLPGDHPQASQLARRTRARTLFVGTSPESQHRVAVRSFEPGRLRVSVDGAVFEIAANGTHFAVPLGMAVVAARELGCFDAQIAHGLKSFEPVPGRCRVAITVPWTLVDDTYNANPDSMRAALDSLAAWPHPRRRIFVCGDMYGLGASTVSDHVELGRHVAKRRIDLLVAIGAQAAHVVAGALQEGMDARRIAAFADRSEAATWLAASLDERDVLWAKGSRPMALEGLIEELCQAAKSFSTRRTAA